MPGWQPNWRDVTFDNSAAERAIDAISAAARLLADQQSARERLAALASAQWRGPAHDRWVEGQRALAADQAALVADLRADAAVIEQAALSARHEQLRREAERTDWYRQRDQELAAGLAGVEVGQAPIAW